MPRRGIWKTLFPLYCDVPGNCNYRVFQHGSAAQDDNVCWSSYQIMSSALLYLLSMYQLTVPEARRLANRGRESSLQALQHTTTGCIQLLNQHLPQRHNCCLLLTNTAVVGGATASLKQGTSPAPQPTYTPVPVFVAGILVRVVTRLATDPSDLLAKSGLKTRRLPI